MARRLYMLLDGRFRIVEGQQYLASCDHCGWIGGSGGCSLATYNDDGAIRCPVCKEPGVDTGGVATTARSLATNLLAAWNHPDPRIFQCRDVEVRMADEDDKRPWMIKVAGRDLESRGRARRFASAQAALKVADQLIGDRVCVPLRLCA